MKYFENNEAKLDYANKKSIKMLKSRQIQQIKYNFMKEIDKKNEEECSSKFDFNFLKYCKKTILDRVKYTE